MKEGGVNKSEVVEAVADAAGIERKQAEAAVTAFIDVVMREAQAGNKVSLFGFGTFTPTARAARMGRNPQTGAPVKIAASRGVRFAPASAFKQSLNARSAAKKASKATAKKRPSKAAPVKKAAKAAKTSKAAKKR
jgi:DNA-binding protein HU-beta